MNEPPNPSDPTADDRVKIRDTNLLGVFLPHRFGEPPLNTSIHVEDEMLGFLVDLLGGDWDRAVATYFETGGRTFAMVEKLARWRFGSLDQIAILDFASGFGRVTRHLLRRFRPDQLVVSDIIAKAMEFQREEFGVEAVVSTTDPEDLDIDRKFDLIIVASLFSHLPEELFRRWLKRLWALVKPGGLIAFSVHDRSLHAGADPSQEFLFVAQSESSVLDPESYGTTWVTEGYVNRVLTSEIGPHSCARLAGGLSNFQDIYVVVREEDVDFTGLDYSRSPDGHIDAANAKGGVLSMYGWAASNDAEHPLASVDFLLNGVDTAKCEMFFERPDVAEHYGDPARLKTGWEINVALPRGIAFGEDVVMVRAVTTGGDSNYLHIGSLQSLISDVARANLDHLRKEHAKLVARVAQTNAVEAGRRIEELESRVAWMENSRFWRMRLSLLRAIGRGDSKPGS